MSARRFAFGQNQVLCCLMVSQYGNHVFRFCNNKRILLCQVFREVSETEVLRFPHNRAYPSEDWVLGWWWVECARSAQQRKCFQTKSLKWKAYTTICSWALPPLLCHYTTWHFDLSICSFLYLPLCKSLHSSLLAGLPVWSEDYIADWLLGHPAGRQANKCKNRCCE